MRRNQVLVLLLYFFLVFPGYSQKLSKADIKKKFIEGNSFFLFEEYSDALPYYLELHDLFPDNNNLNYRIGICYLNIPGQKDKAINYLEKAITDITPKYRENSIRETHAPLDAYFYLGNAYRVNNKLDKALEMYQYFKDHLNPKIYDVQLVDDQIKTCNVAKKLESTPLYLSEKDIGKPINSRFSDYRPVISGDQKTLVFTRKLPFYDAVFYTHKENGTWSPPINLTPELGIDQDFYSSSLSFDGKTLYLYKNDQYDGNIYISKYKEGQWSRVIRLNDHINTKYWESHACVTKDGKTLYFTSNRKGGYGGLDIYISKLDSTGEWGSAVNLGPIINTKYNEETPFITADGKTLFFSSYGHYNMGGYDIFYSNLLDNGEWSVPLNMGYPINTTDDDLFYHPVGKGYYAYISKFSTKGMGNMDIFKIEIFSAEHPRKFLIQGTISTKNIPIKPDNNKLFVRLLSENMMDTLKSINPDTTLHYQFETVAGKYNLAISGEGIKTQVSQLSMPISLNKEVVCMPPAILQLEDQTANLDILNPSFTINAGDTLNLILSTEKGSWLTMRLYQDSVLVDSIGYFVMNDSLIFPILPPAGRSTVVLNLTDHFGNTAQKEIYLNVPVPTPPEVTTAEKKPVHELPKLNITPARLQEMNNFLDILKHYATGSLLVEIQGIDPEAMNFIDQFEIIDYLKKKAIVSSYTPEDVDQLLLIAATRNPEKLEDIYHSLVTNAAGSLKAFLTGLDLAKSNIYTPEQLMKYLKETADSGIIDSTELKHLVVSMATEKDKNLWYMYQHLLDLSSGNIKKAVNQANPEKNEIYSAWELTNFLIDKSELLGYSTINLIYLFARIASNGDPDVNNFLRKLIDKSTGTLHDLLINIDLKFNKINKIKDLLDYLINHASQYHYTENDILKTLTRIIISSNIDEDKVRELMSHGDILTGGKPNYLYWIIPLVLAGVVTGYLLVKKKKM
ncbi:MAG TPA: tetratricopeptide repeat protein [Bacteroidetes bacterium]|nr:tetratricopeptide repeat protein [Bacteroidota bacterium]